MALVVLLRGVNVGGHRTFRPALLAKALAHLDVVNIGAAGTFVVRKAIPRARLLAEFARRLPFETAIMICAGRDITKLAEGDPFAGWPIRRDVVHFVSVLARRPRTGPALPWSVPARGAWQLRLLARDGRFVFGMFRRQMKAVGQLGMIDRLFGAPATTRNWNTITTIARIVDGAPP